MNPRFAASLLAVSLLVAPACNKDPVAPGGGSGGSAAQLGVAESGLRRLSSSEYDQTIYDLFGDVAVAANVSLPADVVDPFDNDATTQEVSAVLVTGLETLAGNVATGVIADPVLRDAIVPCDDAPGCMEQFVRQTGRSVLRRPVTEVEVTALVDLGDTFAADGEFDDGVDVVLRAMLQHPSFVYRVERGTPTGEPGVFRLGPYETATRMSYLFWGSTPDTWLLDQAEAGLLDEPAGVRSTAEAMLDDPRARDRIDRFHAMWMGYWQLPHPAELTHAFRAETRALVEDVVFDQQSSWFDLFTADGTYLTDGLADHYGLPRPGSSEPVWSDYGTSGRQGILAHGSFLSVNAKFGDTSPTLRGKLVRERLLCQTIPPPPPGVNVDEPPLGDGASDCKIDRYAVHASQGTCKSCHDLVDPIGFGIENYDQLGQYREHDVGAPVCTIEGTGDVDGDPFAGPAGLADLLVDGPELTTCAVLQTYRLAMGRDAGPANAPFLDRLIASFPQSGHRLDQLFLDLVGDEAFLHRRDEEVLP